MEIGDVATVTGWYLDAEQCMRRALSGRLSRPDDVDDLAQEVYLRLLRVPCPDTVENPRAYVCRIALNLAQEWRQRAAQAWDHGAPVEMLVADDDPEGEIRSIEQDTTVQEMVCRLPPLQRTAIMLHVFDGLTCAQVAAHMGVTRRAVKRYVENGYAALRDGLRTFPHSELELA